MLIGFSNIQVAAAANAIGITNLSHSGRLITFSVFQVSDINFASIKRLVKKNLIVFIAGSYGEHV